MSEIGISISVTQSLSDSGQPSPPADGSFDPPRKWSVARNALFLGWFGDSDATLFSKFLG